MIIVKHIDDSLYFPIDKQPESATGFTLEMYSELSLTTLTFDELSGEVNDDFIIIDLSEYADQIPNGEYNATLYDCEYEKVSLTLVRFDLEEGGEYDDPEYVVYEDEFDGGYITTQNQQEAFESGFTSGYTYCYPIAYEEGYDEGFDDGVDSVPLISTGFTQNGTFSASTGGFNVVTVDVPTGRTVITITKEEYDILVSAGTIDENAEYLISGYTDNYELGYSSGWTDGYNTSSAGSYQSGFTDGYSSGFTDGVESGFTSGWTTGYQSGFTAGEESVPLVATGFTQNGTFVASTGGWNSVTVNVPSVTTQSLTQEQYDALENKDPMVIYLITN